ncbi:hypothetical protein SUGI_0980830 [Cryptomeria japonica]|nr:hypothetical protein SUGI_0980830 [Cryptomeria japonica]
MTLRHLPRQTSLERRIKHYSNFHQILLVGEGDFSFSLPLAKAFGFSKNMVSTSLDSKEEVLSLYSLAKETLKHLKGCGATILHGVDATVMNRLKILRRRMSDRIVFNFPHAGFYGRE